MTAPALSVQLVVRDVAAWLPAALASLRMQTRRDFEVVAVDDGSTDETPALLADATGLDVRTVFVDRIGLPAARNIAVGHSRAPVVATLDGDDVWLPWYVERILDRFERDRDADIVVPEALIAVDHDLTGSRYYADGHPLRWHETDQLNAIARINFIMPLSAFRRPVFDAAGGYDPALPSASDWDFWIRALHAGARAVHIPEALAVYRLRAGSHIASRTRLLEGRIGVLERAAHRLPPAAAAMARAELAQQRFQLRMALAKESLRRGDVREARRRYAGVAIDRRASLRQRIRSTAIAATPRVAGRLLAQRDARPPTPEQQRRVRE